MRYVSKTDRLDVIRVCNSLKNRAVIVRFLFDWSDKLRAGDLLTNLWEMIAKYRDESLERK